MNFLLSLLLFSAAPLDCKFVRVIDGDTFVVVDTDSKEHTIRLASVDAPELGQHYGTNAKDRLLFKLADHTLTITPTGSKHRGREIARVVADGIDVNESMVAEGYAWCDPRYTPRDKAIWKAEAKARERLAGLWGSFNAVPPWKWREAGRTRKTTARP